jgi:hypothetical protein
MPLSEQARAHRIRVLRHQEKLAAKAEIEGSAESSGQQMTLRLIGKVRGTKTELPSAGRKGARARTARCLCLLSETVLGDEVGAVAALDAVLGDTPLATLPEHTAELVTVRTDGRAGSGAGANEPVPKFADRIRADE